MSVLSRLPAGVLWPLVLFGLLLGGSLGEAAFQSSLASRARQPPSGWQLQGDGAPPEVADWAGDIGVSSDAWTIGRFTGFAPQQTSEVQSLSGTARLEPGGQLTVWLGAAEAQDQRGLGLRISRVGAPSLAVVAAHGKALGSARCEGEAPTWDGGPLDFALSSTTEGQGGVAVTAAGTTLQCERPQNLGPPQLRPGLREVQVADLQVNGQPVGTPSPGPRAAWWLAGGLLLTLVHLLEAWVGLRVALILLGSAPILLVPLLYGADLMSWSESARVSFLPTRWLLLLLPLGSSLFLRGTIHTTRSLREDAGEALGLAPRVGAMAVLGLALLAGAGAFSGLSVGLALVVAVGLGLGLPPLLGLLGSTRPHRSAAVLMGVAALFAVLPQLLGMQPAHPLAAVYAGVGGLCGALVLWANANASGVRAFNLVSLGAFVGMLGAAEGSLRATVAGLAWRSGGSTTEGSSEYGWIRTAIQDFESYDEGEHTEYPMEGFPTAITPSREGTRVVSFGGSTTGGAYQNDDLNQFYPARLGDALGTDF